MFLGRAEHNLLKPAEKESTGSQEDDFSERLASLRKAGGRMPQGESRKTQKKSKSSFDCNMNLGQ